MRALLFLRGIVLSLLIVLIVLGLLLFFTANSPLAIEKVAKMYASDYNISYDDISGNVLTGISLENPQFKHKKLAKNIQLKWNPNTLAAKIITVDKLHIKEGNVEAIKSLVASFSSDKLEDNDTLDENTSSFNFRINAEDVHIDLVPFKQENILFSKVILDIDSLHVNEEGVELDKLILDVESNVTALSLKASMKNEVLMLHDINLSEVALFDLINAFKSDENTSVDERDTKNEKKNIYVPKLVKVENLALEILPFEYKPFKLEHIYLNAKDAIFDVPNLVLKDAMLELNTTSNFSHLHYAGTVKENHLLGKVKLTPKHRLYEYYAIPLRKEAIGNIFIDFNASYERLIADVRAEGKQILEGKKGEFNVDIEELKSHVVYVYNNTHIKAKTQAIVTTPYAKNIMLSNTFNMEDEIFYEGKIIAKKLKGFDVKIAKHFEGMEVVYSGNEQSIEADLTSKMIKALFSSQDFKTGKLHIETTKPSFLNEFLELPEELKDAKVDASIDAPLDFSNFSEIHAKLKVDSNIVNIDADVAYAKDIAIQGKVTVPKNSLLKSYSKEVKWEALSQIDTKVSLAKETLDVSLKSKELDAKVKYALKGGDVKGKLNLAGLVADINGNEREILKIRTKIKSMAELHKSINTFYAIDELPPLEGDISASLELNKLKTAALTLTAPKLIYKVDKKTKHNIKDVKLIASMDDKKLVLKSYSATFNNQKYFSNKQAVITLDDTIKVSNLWVNDELLITGEYQTKSKKGTFTAEAKNFRVKHEIVDIETKINLKINLDHNDTSVVGKVILLKGKVTPNLAAKSFASDSDIIILQHMKKKNKSVFMDNFTLAIQVETKKALRLKQGAMNLRLKPNLTLNMEKGTELLFLGSVEVLKGGTYTFEKKRFVLGKSLIYFTGDVNKPALDMKANYKSLNHFITIAIKGTPIAPDLKFSSSPSLNREQILSLILFDSEAGGDTKSGNDMMKMMGGAMAKAALGDIGVEVDHLAFGEGNSIEVGKKLSSKATVIYINGEIPKVKLKYQHDKRAESVIGVSEESQSYDIIFKQDF